MLAVGVPGDRGWTTNAWARPWTPPSTRCSTTPTSPATRSLVKGYIGPKGLQDNGVRYLVDPRVVDGTSWITGADAAGKHVVGLVAGRGFHPGRHHRGRRRSATAILA